MFDLTLKKEDKDSYIVDVQLNDNGTFTVRFASSREETFEFSVHNFQVELYRMEEQYRKYGKDYLDRVYTNGGIRTAILGMVLVVDVLAFKNMLDQDFSFASAWCLSYGLYILLSRGIPQFKQRKLYVEAKKKLAVLKKYFENREELKVQVVNPYTDKEEDWYLVNLANIDQFDTVKEYDKYVSGLNEEQKLEEAQKLSLKFKGFKEKKKSE